MSKKKIVKTEFPVSPIGDKVVVKLIEKSKVSSGGIILTIADSSEANRGEVFAVGNKVLDVSVGDIVLPNWNKAQKTSIDGEEYYIVQEEDIVLIFG